MSVIVRSTLTLVRPPANTQKRPLTLHPFSTLTTASTFDGLKNHRSPVPLVMETAWALPDPEVPLSNVAVTLKRSLPRHSAESSGSHSGATPRPLNGGNTPPRQPRNAAKHAP